MNGAGEQGRLRRSAKTALRPSGEHDNRGPVLLQELLRPVPPRWQGRPDRALPGDTGKNNKAPRRCFTRSYSPPGKRQAAAGQAGEAGAATPPPPPGPLPRRRRESRRRRGGPPGGGGAGPDGHQQVSAVTGRLRPPAPAARPRG